MARSVWGGGLFHVLLLVLLIAGVQGEELAFTDGWPACERRALQRSGYIDIPGIKGTVKHYFYWLFGPRHRPSDGSEPPVVMWMTGGPGCSSGIALLLENGPCLMNESSGELYHNPYGWNDEAYLLYVDQPTGVGYSYGEKINYAHNESEVAEDMYHFLQGFAREVTQPSISGANPFYIIGESYGGHYVPSVAYRVLLGNQRKEGRPIQLRGIGIGNGLTDPYTQYPSYVTVAVDWCRAKLGKPCISEEQQASMIAQLPACLERIATCNQGPTDEDISCLEAFQMCERYAGVFQTTGLNVYDIRKPCEGDLCYPMQSTINFFGDPRVQRHLGVPEEAHLTWETCDNTVNSMFSRDFLRNFNHTIPPLLSAGMSVMIYAGDMDYICNWIGNKEWVLALNWPGKEGLNAREDVEFLVGGRPAGKERRYEQLSFVQVYDAGHMVPMDQPEVSLYLLRQFLKGQPLA